MANFIKKALKAGFCLMAGVIAVSASGCGEEPSVIPPKTEDGISMGWDGGNYSVNSNVKDFKVDGKIHDYTATDTDFYLVENGASEYSVVYSGSASDRVNTAVKEFRTFFMEATGCYLPAVKAESASYTDDSKYIVIGENAVSEKAKLSPDYNVLGVNGFNIKTVGRSVFVYGYTDEGTQFGAYQLLSMLFNYDFYGVDTYTIDSGIKNVRLKNYNVTDVPDIELRATNYQFLMSDKVTAQRLRLTNFGDLCIPVGGKTVHNSFAYIDPNKHKDKADKWFSTDKKNLCYTARGNADELAAMQSIVFNTIKDKFIEYPNRNVITMTHEDTQTLCTCDACSALAAHYGGSQAASIIKFLNKVCADIDGWFETEEGAPYKRDYQVWFFAYHATNQPPVKKNASGQYELIDDEVIMSDHLCAYFAETNADYTKSFYDADSVNVQYAENLKGWAILSKKLPFWMYSTNFSYFLTPYNTFNTMQETYKCAIENKVYYIYDQGQSNQTGSATGWSWLKIYLYSKLTWNIDQNIDELINRFMEGYFGAGAENMKKLFYEYKSFATYQTEKLGYTGSRSIFYNALNSELWPKQLLTAWTGYATQALEDIQYLKKENYSQYQIYLKNISTERIAYNYLLLKLHQALMTPEDVANAKACFYADQNLANIYRESERGGTVTALMQSWGII